jgi:hypothetical protein
LFSVSPTNSMSSPIGSYGTSRPHGAHGKHR